MKTSSTGRSLIEKYEGCILTAYDDYNDKIVKSVDAVKGTLTIGYGHTSAAGFPQVYVGQKITQEQADEILGHDINSVEVEVARLVKVPLNQNQFDALVSFQFNTGALSRSSVLIYLNKGDYATAAQRLTLYNKANGKIQPGLIKRRADEKALFEKLYTSVSTVGKAAGPIIIAGSAATAAYPHLWLHIAIGTFIATLVVTMGILIYKK